MAVKPPRLTHSSIIRSLPWRRLTSVRTKQPVFNVSPSGSSRSPRTRFAPSAAKRSALARPMPLAAPVMTAALPARRPSLTVGTLHRSHLEGDETAVDRVVAACDEGSGIRAEEQGELGGPLRPAHPADRLA